MLWPEIPEEFLGPSHKRACTLIRLMLQQQMCRLLLQQDSESVDGRKRIAYKANYKRPSFLRRITQW